ncbi:hypothetical protein BJY00DRAFT_282156 [Aspergillus carlsbadensis]|nr:hypothetical protein BJY00DRAFT_282156 [Aspergillus carlsbadensis]
MANLKKALKATNGRDELSLTIPTSYWYLQHFDVKGLAPHGDFFNYMSSDLHGTWDRGNKWTGSLLNAHTNLTEIRGTLDLLWRNQIPPSKVVLGLAFYSRAFTVENTNSVDPGCTFLSAADAGPCSAEAGILLNNELDDIRSERGISGTLDEEAAVKLLSWDDQWTAYDDEETLEMKIDFAGETCLGGIMVWAVSHDNWDHRYSRALGTVLIRPKPHNLVEVDDSGTITVQSHKPQCRWTGCGQTCFKGFSPVPRGDAGAAKGELMLDSTKCVEGVQTLCCPNESIPKCGWYSWNNGKFDPACPDNMFEIGSHNKGCNERYQSACCERGKPTIELYDVLEWEPTFQCDLGSCPVSPDKTKSEVLGESRHGSGVRPCLGEFIKWDLLLPVFEITYRKLCYNPNEPLKSWDDCDWYNDWDPPPEGKSEGYCSSTCPSGTVRLAMEQTNECLRHGGGHRVFCCKDGFYTTQTRPDPSIQRFANVLDKYELDGSCDFLPGPNVEGEEVEVSPQYRSDVIEFTIPETAKIIKEVSPDARQRKIGDIWDDRFALEHEVENLQMGVMKPNLFNNYVFIEKWAEFVANGLWCRPQIYNETLETEEIPWPCLGDPCDPDADPELCETEEREDGDAPDVMPDPDSLLESSTSTSPLDKRVAPKVFRVFCHNAPAPGISQGWQTGLTTKPRTYYQAGLWGAHTRVFQNALSYMSATDCGNPDLKPEIKTGRHHDTEHILELQISAQFLQYATWGRLVDGSTAAFNPIPCELFIPRARGGAGILEDNSMMNLNRFPLFSGDLLSAEPAARLMNALGSKENGGDFYLLEKVVNGMKSRVFANKGLMDDTRRSLVIANTAQPGQILGEIKAAIAVWIYLNRPEVLDSLKVLVRNVRKVLVHLEGNYNTQNPNSRIDLQSAWDEWFNHMIKYHADRTSRWVTETIVMTATYWNTVVPPNHPFRPAVIGSLRALQGWNFWRVDWAHPPIV